jgi:hypothetical protein
MLSGMSIAQRRPMTVDEFLAWERRQELRYEFDGFAPVAMTGGTTRSWYSKSCPPASPRRTG